jgi:general secretion pathway protein J
MTGRDRPSIAMHRHHGGFTLLEMLVVLIVLGFLMLGLNQGVRTGLGFWTVQSRQIGNTAELDTTARILRMLLTGLPIAPAAAINPGAAPMALSFAGAADHLTFVGDLPTGLGNTHRADITIEARGGRLVLVWSPHRHELASTKPASNDTELLRGVARLDLAYWGTTAPDSPASWLAQWDGPAIPQLVRIRLTFAKGDARHWPDMIVAPQLWSPAI